MSFFVENIHTIILFPLWIFLLIVLGRFLNVVQSKKVISLITLISTLYGLIFSLGCLFLFIKTPDFVYENSFSFLKLDDYVLNFGVYVDNLSAMMLLVVTTVSLIVQFYSIEYMGKDKSFPRFFGYLNLFNFSMLGLVLSSNLFQTYVFWELVGVSSYLLIGFWYKRQSASFAAKKAFIMNRIGDFGLLAGVISLSYFMYQYSGDNSLATVPFVNINDIANYLYSYTNDFTYVIICVFLFMGSMAKSAQFPLHTWLPDAMEGPTPVSALIHSATMVAAGVFLVARLYPVFVLSEGVMYFIAAVGLFTALICAYFAITQNDLKRILAYSTNSQLGLMFVALGCGAYAGGLFHLLTHAYFKSMLFLCSGIVIHGVNQQDVRFMGGLRKYMPTAAICYLIGCFSISGLFFSGFYSKESIISFLFSNNHLIFAIGFLIVSLLTAFYMFRSYFTVFEGDFRGETVPHKTSLILNSSVLYLALFTVFVGISIYRVFPAFIQQTPVFIQIKEGDFALVSILVALVGFLAAFVFYNTKIKAFKVPMLYKLSYNRFYIDDLYAIVSDKVYYAVAKICAIFDKYILDGLVVLAGLNVRAASWVFSKLQTGNFQSYIAYSAIFLAFVFAMLMLAYTVIINTGLASGY